MLADVRMAKVRFTGTCRHLKHMHRYTQTHSVSDVYRRAPQMLAIKVISRKHTRSPKSGGITGKAGTSLVEAAADWVVLAEFSLTPNPSFSFTLLFPYL